MNLRAMTLRIGILQCDQVSDDLREEFGDYPKIFSDLLTKVRPDWCFSSYRVFADEIPAELDECDAYITTGSTSGVNEAYEWIVRLEQLVRNLAETTIPYVGICFGHQMLAKALGGKVEPTDSGWGVGIHTSTLSELSLGEIRLPPEIDLLVSHADQVVELPAGCEVVGHSEFCPVAWMRYGGTMLGIQGHPEFSKAYARALIERRREVIGEAVSDAGLRSLVGEPDTEAAFELIAQFIEQANQVHISKTCD
jgi:GMP synthase-like glutamine amidotransferase